MAEQGHRWPNIAKDYQMLSKIAKDCLILPKTAKYYQNCWRKSSLSSSSSLSSLSQDPPIPWFPIPRTPNLLKPWSSDYPIPWSSDPLIPWSSDPLIPWSPDPPYPRSPNPRIPRSPDPQIPRSPNPQIPRSPDLRSSDPPIPLLGPARRTNRQTTRLPYIAIKILDQQKMGYTISNIFYEVVIYNVQLKALFLLCQQSQIKSF